MDDKPTHQVLIATEASAIKTIKTTLDKLGIFDKISGIQKIDPTTANKFIALEGQVSLSQYHSLIPTTISINLEAQSNHTTPPELKDVLQLFSTTALKYSLFAAHRDALSRAKDNRQFNRVAKAVRDWLRQLDICSANEIEDIVKAESWNFEIYPPMLLLGSSTFKSDAWQTMAASKTDTETLSMLYWMMAAATNCTHVAINGAIPLEVAGESPLHDSRLNILRTPSRLLPIYGDFGSSTDTPSGPAFEKALWVSIVQNGIYQTFAPVHTMFSQGNVKEKARILRMAEQETTPFSAVDLYAGIGYFAFSYARGGAEVVLGWEINGWSAQGFLRGARWRWYDVLSIDKSNDRDVRAWLGTQFTVQKPPPPKLVVFEESNEEAPQRVRHLRDTIPPIKHVNCGYLPTSRQSWPLAMQCLDPMEGGCIHVHENVGIEEINTRRSEIESTFEALVEAHLSGSGFTVLCERVERVKSYAPGVWHCVFDMRVRRPENEDDSGTLH